MSAPEPLRLELQHRLRRAQADDRLPSVTAAVFRDGEILWQEAVGLADVDAATVASVNTQYRIGSITKAFTAVCVLQLRDAGRLDLDDPLDRHLPETGRSWTLRQLLSHLAGVQREPPGDIWETLAPPSAEELLASLPEAEQVLRPGTWWHYSNLAFSLLGEVVARVSGCPYADYLRERVLEPLDLRRTTFDRTPPAASGYLVEPYADLARREPDLEWVGSGASGWLWSTVTDLAAFGAFLAAGREGVLARSTLDEMARVHALVDHRAWTLAWGLGLALRRSGDRVYAGHTGAMPGHLAGLVVHRESGTGAAFLTNAGTRAKPATRAVELADATLAALPPTPVEWRPGTPVPAEVEPLLGVWWSEGDRLVVRWRDGRLELHVPSEEEGRNVAVLAPEDDGYRIVEGYERGERVRVVRDASGAVTKLYVATYPATREPRTFG